MWGAFGLLKIKSFQQFFKEKLSQEPFYSMQVSGLGSLVHNYMVVYWFTRKTAHKAWELWFVQELLLFKIIYKKKTRRPSVTVVNGNLI
jgi:hypothetical protein